MTISSVSATGRLAAVAASATLAVASIAAVPTAGAATGAVDYSCSSTNGVPGFTLPVVIDTNAPARVPAGQTVQVVVTTSATIPGAVAKSKYDTGARSFDGPWTTRAAFGSAPATIEQAIPRTSLNDQTVANPVGFVATSASFAWTAPSTPGTVEVTAGGLSGTWAFYDNNGASLGTTGITCTAPNGKPPVIDTIAVVASSTTNLVLDKAAADYGQDVTATAKVTTSSGSPDGEVAFSVDGGVATRVRVDKDGVAVLSLPDAAVGAHDVVATFVPRDPTTYDGSSSVAQRLTVAKVRTKMRVPVSGRTTATATRVGVRAEGTYATVPTGKVRIKLQRVGRTAKTIKVRTLSDTGTATAGFGRLKTGRYQVTVVYRGDANHRYVKKSKTFRVTRG